MLILKNEHITYLETIAREDFFKRVRAKLQDVDVRAAETPSVELNLFIERQYQAAKRHHLITEKQCLIWILTTWIHGEHIVEKNGYISALLENPLADADAKAEALWRWHIQQDLLKKEAMI